MRPLSRIAAVHQRANRGDAMKGWIGRHPLTSYFVAAYAISWSIAVPLALQAHNILPYRLPWTLHYLTAFGPAGAALLVKRLTREPTTGRKSPRRKSVIAWWIVGFTSPLILFAIATSATRIIGQAVPTWSSLGQINYLPDLGLAAWGLWFLTSGCGEEFGWRGFALPRLQRTHSAMTSSLLLAIGWAGWHLPALLYLPSYAAIGLRILPGFFVGILAGAIVLTWLYNRSGGSVIAAVLWHSSFNFVTASPNAAGAAVAVTSVLVIAWAIVIVVRDDWTTLATRAFRRSVRASRAEKTRALPGDELILECIGALDHAIAIRRPPRDVWPWLAQMGAGTRAGWYSYDLIDNGRRPSADRIIPELQQLEVGMIFPALPAATDGFTLLAFERERYLVLGWLAPDGTRLMTWAFVLEHIEHDSTRLIVRARGGPGYRFHGLPWRASKRLVAAIHFTMQRKQLHGIAQRAEAIMSRSSAFKTPEGEVAFIAAYDALMKRWPVPYEELNVPTRFGTTHVVVCGPKDAPPLVLLHGYMGTAIMWAPNIIDFSKDHRVYAIDVMGQPSKSIPDEPIRNAADYIIWLTATLNALHLDRIALVGMSFGGWIALRYAVAAPDRVHKLVLLSPGGLLQIRRQFTLRGMAMVFFPTRFTVNSFMHWAGFSTAPGEADASPIVNLMYLGMKHFQMLADTMRIAAHPVSDDELRGVQVPTLLLFGENEVLCDPMEALARARRLIPDFRGELLPSSSHDMSVSQHAIVDARIREFLTDARHDVPEQSVA